MCRHLAYLGEPAALGRVLVEPPHGLYRQSWAPRRQRYGTVNADGFGVGWYAEDDPVPARYRRSGPLWADPSFADLARVVRSGALLAAVRDATEGSAPGETAAAPFAAGPWLFSHNGAIRGWPGSVAGLAAGLPPEELLALEARCDSALAWALVLHRLRGGGGGGNPDPRGPAGSVSADPLPPAPLAPGPRPGRGRDGSGPRRLPGQPLGDALAETTGDIAGCSPDSRLNFLLTDGATIAATAWGDTLWYRTGPGRCTVVASEPYDDDAGWTEVPDRHLITATRTDVLVSPLKEPHP